MFGWISGFSALPSTPRQNQWQIKTDATKADIVFSLISNANIVLFQTVVLNYIFQCLICKGLLTAKFQWKLIYMVFI